jgi:hypothetical protein
VNFLGENQMKSAELLARQIEGTRDWTLKLIADLKGDDWSFQPAPGLAHALWLCGHLACAQDLLVHRRVLGGAGVIRDEFSRHFPIGGDIKPSAEHDYPPIATVLAMMERVHTETCSAVRGMNDEFLAGPAFGGDGKPHPHYDDKAGAIAHCNRHEAFHAGQLAMIRRLLGKPFLR